MFTIISRLAYEQSSDEEEAESEKAPLTMDDIERIRVSNQSKLFCFISTSYRTKFCRRQWKTFS